MRCDYLKTVQDHLTWWWPQGHWRDQLYFFFNWSHWRPALWPGYSWSGFLRLDWARATRVLNHHAPHIFYICFLWQGVQRFQSWTRAGPFRPLDDLASNPGQFLKGERGQLPMGMLLIQQLIRILCHDGFRLCLCRDGRCQIFNLDPKNIHDR